MPWKRKNDTIDPNREPGGCCSDAIGIGDVTELGEQSLEEARSAVRARPLTATAAALGVGAIIASLFLR